MDEGELAVVYAFGEAVEFVAFNLDVVKGFERGGGGAEYADGVAEHGAVDADVAAVVSGYFALFEGGVVFFVDNDEF